MKEKKKHLKNFLKHFKLSVSFRREIVMKAKKIAATGLAAAMSMAVLAGCGPKSEVVTTTTVTIAFDTDMSSMDNSVATDGSSFSMQ